MSLETAQLASDETAWVKTARLENWEWRESMQALESFRAAERTSRSFRAIDCCPTQPELPLGVLGSLTLFLSFVSQGAFKAFSIVLG